MDFCGLIIKLQKIRKGEVVTLGHSCLGRDIYGVFYNFKSEQNLLISGAIHAREHITSDLIMWLIDCLEHSNTKARLNLPNIMFIPCVNPDGMELVNRGLDSVKNAKYTTKLEKMVQNCDFCDFKANICGVDLNNNFDAKFGTDPRYAIAPSAHGYNGVVPESEPESKLLAELARFLNPDFTISFHSKGEEIYYNFHLDSGRKKYHKKTAEYFSKLTGYKLVDDTGVSAGGFKDYCIEKLEIPSITIEVGSDDLAHPIPSDKLSTITPHFEGFYEAVNRAFLYIKKHKNKF